MPGETGTGLKPQLKSQHLPEQVPTAAQGAGLSPAPARAGCLPTGPHQPCLLLKWLVLGLFPRCAQRLQLQPQMMSAALCDKCPRKALKAGNFEAGITRRKCFLFSKHRQKKAPTFSSRQFSFDVGFVS